MRAFGADDGTPLPHAFGVDNTACSFHSHKNTPSAWMMPAARRSCFSVLFPTRVTSAEFHWSTLGKRPSGGESPPPNLMEVKG